ncbi:response regulator receiver domain-containing protein [Geothermobacter ehrlichii]|uniref:Response regulator receiver domain-containing protein n=1 Tax=Geothermobacter ehrlichii TaxID=213224 RepID=A0A5D3WMR9_9BACT|nr:response regulator [Geothermobacter ehrlichii]TYO99656.1 response regulator receiver domain-containing protein [Geothermobacter ehrlichii]
MENRSILTGEQIRILCVDDERNVLKALRRIFIDDDWEIFVAESATEGLEILRQEEEIQLVVSDYRMPGMNGVEFLGEVCRYWPDTIRIVLSGYADAASIVAAINEGQIYKFIPKPWNDDELKVTLQTALEHYFLQKKNRELMAQLRQTNSELEHINDHLEQLVLERTEKLQIQNEALQISQSILDALPVGVIGLDLEGMVVRTNRVGMHFLGLDNEFVVGLSRFEVLPDELNRLVDGLEDRHCIQGEFEISGRVLKYWVTRLSNPRQEGLIVSLVDASGRRLCDTFAEDWTGDGLCLMA